MKLINIFSIAILLLTADSIFIKLNEKSTRCMIEFIIGSGKVNTVKIKIIFPELENEVPGEHFYLSLRNTQTNQTQGKPIKPGTKYYEEQQFQDNVIYELCITFRTEREISAFVDYETERLYNYNQQIVKVPENLLTKSDFKEAFMSASFLKKIIADYNQEHQMRKQEEYKQFEVTKQINKKVTIISSIELIVLLAAGLYQFFTLKNYLSTKQYI